MLKKKKVLKNHVATKHTYEKIYIVWKKYLIKIHRPRCVIYCTKYYTTNIRTSKILLPTTQTETTE